MAAVRKRKIRKEEYYYLEHSFKLNGKVKKKELYLGKNIPKNIDKLKSDFLNEIYYEKWFKQLDKIKKKFSKEFSQMPRVAREKYIENFMIKFTYNSNRIEGSKITLRETARLLEDGVTPVNKPLNDVKEAESHKDVFFHMLKYKKELNFEEVLYWHKLLFSESEKEIAGIIRKHSVAVAGSKAQFPYPAELDFLLREFFKWYNENKNKIHPVKLAALVHLKFVSVHPFSDGNGRISRLMMNFVLNKHKFPMLDISYSNRANYYTALERSQVKHLDDIFLKHIIKRYLKDYKKYI